MVLEIEFSPQVYLYKYSDRITAEDSNSARIHIAKYYLQCSLIVKMFKYMYILRYFLIRRESNVCIFIITVVR